MCTDIWKKFLAFVDDEEMITSQLLEWGEQYFKLEKLNVMAFGQVVLGILANLYIYK